MLSLKEKDPRLFRLISQEAKRQQETLMMIPSENYTFPAAREAVGSVLSHKYAEGYPKKRYYQGMKFVDQVEILAQQRAQKLFGVPYANVQPYSGSPANAAVYFALLEAGETVMGLQLDHGGHLTHGHPKITFSGRWFKSFPYQIKETPPYFDFEQILKKAKKHRPKIIVVGTTAFPRTLPWKKFAIIANAVNAYLVADIAHIAGLVAGGAHSSPAHFVHIITTTTHKTLRGPRGALIMVTKKGLKKDPDLGKKINRAVFPGLQGGPHLHTIAGIAVTLKLAGQASFRKYAHQVVKNATVLAEELSKQGFRLVTKGTDNHLLLVDLRNFNLGGKLAAVKLEKAGIVVNANAIPYDPAPPYRPSGIRLGTPALTARGMKAGQMRQIARLIARVIKSAASQRKRQQKVHQEVKTLCRQFPIL